MTLFSFSTLPLNLKYNICSHFKGASRAIAFALTANVPLSGGSNLSLSGFPNSMSATTPLLFSQGSSASQIDLSKCLGFVQGNAQLSGGVLSVPIRSNCSIPTFTDVVFAIQVPTNYLKTIMT